MRFECSTPASWPAESTLSYIHGSRRFSRQLIRFGHPTPAHSLVGVDKCWDYVVLCLRVGQLGVKEAALSIEDLQIARIAALEAKARKARVMAQGIDLARLGGEPLTGFQNQRNGGFSLPEMACPLTRHSTERKRHRREARLGGQPPSKPDVAGEGIHGRRLPELNHEIEAPWSQVLLTESSHPWRGTAGAIFSASITQPAAHSLVDIDELGQAIAPGSGHGRARR